MPSKSKEELAEEYALKSGYRQTYDRCRLAEGFEAGYAAGLESDEVKGLANVIGAVIERYETKNSPQASNLLKGCTYGTYLILRLALQAFRSKIGGGK